MRGPGRIRAGDARGRHQGCGLERKAAGKDASTGCSCHCSARADRGRASGDYREGGRGRRALESLEECQRDRDGDEHQAAQRSAMPLLGLVDGEPTPSPPDTLAGVRSGMITGVGKQRTVPFSSSKGSALNTPKKAVRPRSRRPRPRKLSRRPKPRRKLSAENRNQRPPLLPLPLLPSPRRPATAPCQP